MPKRRRNSGVDSDIFVAGALAGLASKLNVGRLTEYLDNGAPEDFSYANFCRAAIEFATKVQKGI